MGCVEEQWGGSGLLAPEQMACRKPIDKNIGLKGGGGGSDWAQWFAAKRKTCLVDFPKQSHNTAVQVAAEGKRVCL